MKHVFITGVAGFIGSSLARTMLERGKIRSVRCSTRPDCITPAILQQLAAAGVTTVELGIQSFAAPALEAAQRGYSPQVALEAAKAVTASTMRLGIQLMPGMPGQPGMRQGGRLLIST